MPASSGYGMALLKSSATSSAAICYALLAAKVRDLLRLFQPKSIAVFGGWWAENVVTQCQKNGFEGVSGRFIQREMTSMGSPATEMSPICQPDPTQHFWGSIAMRQLR